MNRLSRSWASSSTGGAVSLQGVPREQRDPTPPGRPDRLAGRQLSGGGAAMSNESEWYPLVEPDAAPASAEYPIHATAPDGRKAWIEKVDGAYKTGGDATSWQEFVEIIGSALYSTYAKPSEGTIPRTHNNSEGNDLGHDEGQNPRTSSEGTVDATAEAMGRLNRAAMERPCSSRPARRTARQRRKPSRPGPLHQAKPGPWADGSACVPRGGARREVGLSDACNTFGSTSATARESSLVRAWKCSRRPVVRG